MTAVGHRLLLIATLPWVFPARLACALRKAGFHVEAVCRSSHPICNLKTPVPQHRLGRLQEAASVKRAIEHANPDLLIPCDDPAVRILHQLYCQAGPGKLADLIARSLGEPASSENA